MRRVRFIVAVFAACLGALAPGSAVADESYHPDHADDADAAPEASQIAHRTGRVSAASAPAARSVVVAAGAPTPPHVTHQPHDAVVGGAARSTGAGWFVTATGAVRAYGGAPHYGDIAHLELNEPIVAMAATPTGNGYWLVSSDGGIFAFGDAGYHGSTGALRLARPIVDIAPSSDGGGYLLAADDGGVFAFGSAVYRGSMGHVALNQPIVGVSLTNDGDGYWLVAQDGGMFAFGGADFHGSTGSAPPSSPVVDVVETDEGHGYWLVTETGDVLPFGGAAELTAPQGGTAGAVVGAVRQGDGLWLTVHPDTPVVYAWQSGGLEAHVLDAVIEGATIADGSVALTHLGTVGVHEFRREGQPYQSAPGGWQFGFTARAVPRTTAAIFHGGDVARALERGDVVLSERSAALRGARVGDTVVFSGWDDRLHERRIGAIVPDRRVAFSELTFADDDAASFGFVRPASIWITGVSNLSVLENALTAIAATEPWVRWSRSWDPSSPDSTLPTVRLKELLGEFHYRLGSSALIEMDPAWVGANIVRAELPILGGWRCHRAILPDLTAALAEIQAEGLSHLIDVRDSRNGGCWVARRIRGAFGGALSRHAWGLAVDINPSTNAWGASPTMDPRIVEIFRENGFAWGGTWTRPDGMHFEWVGR